MLLPVLLALLGCTLMKAAVREGLDAKPAPVSAAKPVAPTPPATTPAKPQRSMEELEKDPRYKYWVEFKRLFDSSMERSAVFASSHPGARLAVLLFFRRAPTTVSLERLQAEAKVLFPQVRERARLRAHVVLDASVPAEMRPEFDKRLKARERALALTPPAPGVPTLTLFVDGPVTFEEVEGLVTLTSRGNDFSADEHVRTASSSVRAVWSDGSGRALPAVKFKLETTDRYLVHDAQPKLRISAEHGHFLPPEVHKARHLKDAGGLLAAKALEVISAQAAASAPADTAASPEAKIERLMHGFLREPNLTKEAAQPLQAALIEWVAMPVLEADRNGSHVSANSMFDKGMAACELDGRSPDEVR